MLEFITLISFVTKEFVCTSIQLNGQALCLVFTYGQFIFLGEWIGLGFLITHNLDILAYTTLKKLVEDFPNLVKVFFKNLAKKYLVKFPGLVSKVV